MNINHWPALERPREKFIHQGASALSDAELLAIFLRTGVSGISAVDLARHLLKEAGGLRHLLSADINTLKKYKGMGTAKSVQLLATIELCHRFIAQELVQGIQFDSDTVARDYLTVRLRHLKKEVFACLFLNNQHQLISFEILFEGTLNESQVHPREVLVASLKHHASAVIFAHNHPSGSSTPSTADIQITKRLISALALVDIQVLDHIIVGEKAVSMAGLGLLSHST